MKMAKRRRSAPAEEPRDPRLLAVADRVRTAYILAYRRHVLQNRGVVSRYGETALPRWDGGEASDGKHYKPYWFKPAILCLELGVTPESLVEAAFSAWSAPQPPWPTILSSDSTRRRAACLAESEQAAAGDGLEAERAAFQIRVNDLVTYYGATPESACRRANQDPKLGLSPLFRYCAARQGGAADLAARYAEDAFHQYLFNRRAYDLIWGDLIPGDLRAAADAFCSQLLGGNHGG